MPASLGRPRVIPRPIDRFLNTESSGGMTLIVTAALAFLWANSPYAASYHALQHVPIGLAVGPWAFSQSLLHWVNDALMALFFFVVGLEIKRELLCGELQGWRRASLPAAGALGGMVVPALIFLWLTWGTPFTPGWGVPMATDIAFAVGVLALLGKRVPLTLKVFLLALAIVDDLGAVLVIAVFYTADLNLMALAAALGLFLVALLYGQKGGANPLVYVLLGVPLWMAMFTSGVHATVAGVLLALTVPQGGGISPRDLRRHLAQAMGGGDFEEVEGRLNELERVVDAAQSPLHEFEHTLQPWVAFLIMPVFAFVNAGVTIGAGEGGSPVAAPALAVFMGLLVGKPIGIVGAVALATLLRITSLPPGITWIRIAGAGMLAGIGFTMAIFIANLAFGEGEVLDRAKLGILGASVAAAVLGYLALHLTLPRTAATAARPVTA